MTETRGGPRWFWLTASLLGLLTVAFLVWVILFPNGAGWSNPAFPELKVEIEVIAAR